MRSRSSVVGPGRRPWSRSACRTQLRSVSPEQPIFSAIERIANHCEACSPWWSRTIRTARARTSEEYGGTRFVMAPSSQELEPPEIPGRFRIVFRVDPSSSAPSEPRRSLPYCPTRRHPPSHAARQQRVPLVGKGGPRGMSIRWQTYQIRRQRRRSVPRRDGALAIAWVPLRPRASRLEWTAYLTSRDWRFRHHHAAAHTDRGENHDPTGTLITAQALNGGLDR